MYADVQWVGKDIEKELTEDKVGENKIADLKGKIHDDLLERFLLLEEEMKLMKNGIDHKIKIATGQRGEELDSEKYRLLISKYRMFKTSNVKHVRFNSAANVSKFGKPINCLLIKDEIYHQVRCYPHLPSN